ncbi:hypothetical protein ACXYMO_03005 [Arenibacterium sp. CAU 1754]
MIAVKLIVPALTAVALIVPGVGLAKDKPNKGGKPAVVAQMQKHGKGGKPSKPGRGAGPGNAISPPGLAAPCPPGLAKKNPPCIPPGQVKNRARHRYTVGQNILNDYVIIRNPMLYGLDRYALYYLVGNEIYLMDRDTRKILAFVGLASVLLQ